MTLCNTDTKGYASYVLQLPRVDGVLLFTIHSHPVRVLWSVRLTVIVLDSRSAVLTAATEHANCQVSLRHRSYIMVKKTCHFCLNSSVKHW